MALLRGAAAAAATNGQKKAQLWRRGRARASWVGGLERPVVPRKCRRAKSGTMYFHFQIGPLNVSSFQHLQVLSHACLFARARGGKKHLLPHPGTLNPSKSNDGNRPDELTKRSSSLLTLHRRGARLGPLVPARRLRGGKQELLAYSIVHTYLIEYIQRRMDGASLSLGGNE